MQAEPGSSSDASPRSTYESRRAARGAEAARWGRQAGTIANARLATFVLALGLGCAALASERVWAGLPLGLLGLFAALVLAHERVRRREQRATRAMQLYEDGLARIDQRHAGRGKSGDRFADVEHPYAVHLDLFGAGSLYERLCRAQTRAGEETLARWLLAPAELAEVRARHRAVDELRPDLDLRERLAVVGPEVRAGMDPDGLVGWAEAPAASLLRWRWAAGGLVALTATTMALCFETDLPWGVWAVLVALQGAFGLTLRGRVRGVLAGVERPARDLELLGTLLAEIEDERFESVRLRELHASLVPGRERPSREIARLVRRIRLLEARRNQLFAPLAPFLLWGTQIAIGIEGWRLRVGGQLAGWLEAIGELEALCDLASYAYERPEDPFPELSCEGPCFEARELGHPLIQDERCVRNDVALDADRALLVVSGSNMSGKSTLLRSVGTNLVLALAGAPVRARSLRVSSLAIGASLRVEDSLQQGVSRFYAELRGLRRAVDLVEGPHPLLFLFDEILQGTNSHDRRIGATALIRSLLERGAIGLITTHDLALTEIVDGLAGRARNVHFVDELVDGELCFDYRLHEGVVRRSNALDLMRSFGLVD